MRISDLSRQTGLPVATIKFYLRERLLPAGRPTSRNQAQYGDGHRRRLRFIRALTNILDFDLSSVRELLTAIDNERLSMRELYEIVNRVRFHDNAAEDQDVITDQASSDVDAFLKQLGWHVQPDAASRRRLVQILTALHSLGCESGMDFFLPYAEAAERLGLRELELLPLEGSTDRAAAVARAVLLDAALSAMRRMAQEHLVAMRFDDAAVDHGPA